MPYSSVNELPKQTASLSPEQKKKFKEAFNSAYEKHGEERAFKIAWSAVKKAHPDFSTSAMVCLLPAEPGEIPSARDEFLHVTLCFLGKEGIPEGAGRSVRRVARYLPIRARVAGAGTLGDEDPPATVLFLNGKGLREAQGLAQVHGAPEQHEPYIAHLTVGYGTPLARAKKMIGQEILLDRVALVQGKTIITEVGVKDMAKSDSYASGMDLQISEISKLDEDQQQAFGWASIASVDGRPVVDLQGDVIGIDELEKAAYSYVLDSRVGGVMHQRVDKSQPKKVGTLIESFVVTPEKIEKMGLPDDTPQGWWIGFQVEDDEVWKGVKEGTYSMFSIHGKGRREPVELTEERLEKYAGWVGDVSKSLELEPDEVEDALGVLLSKAGLEPTDTNLVALVETVEDEIGHAESVEYLAKHLIGNHDQEDHDPTKSGKFHTRSQHTQENLGAKVGAAALGGAGAIGGTAIGGPKLGAMLAAQGAAGGGVLGYSLGGGQIFGGASGTPQGALAGTGNVLIGGIPQILRRAIHGDPNKRFQKNSPDQADVHAEGEDEKKRKDKSLTDRQRRVLSRHLGMKDEP